MFHDLFNPSTIERHLVCFQSFISVLEVKLLDQRVHEFLILKFISKIVFYRDCTSENFHQGCMRASVFMPCCQSGVVITLHVTTLLGETLAPQRIHLQEWSSPSSTQHPHALLSPGCCACLSVCWPFVLEEHLICCGSELFL